ncbi:MAG: hypothetical protein IJ776_08040 [Paludibacteraceae bacterium]|nr:hypothetical protein [Paludibacteraceae bacterium]
MKKNHLLIMVAVAVLTACNQTTDNSVLLRPVKQADYVIYSGSHTHESSLPDVAGKAKQSHRAPAAAFAYYKVWDGNLPAEYKDRFPEAVGSEEKTYVINYIRQHPQEGSQVFLCENYFVQNIGSSFDYYTGNTLVDHNGAQHGVTGGNQMDYLVINGNHINDYNSTWGQDALCLNLPLEDPTYHDSWGDKDNTKHNAWTVYEIEGYGYYLCFDYRTAKNSGEYYDGDGVYNDWVIKLVPADGTNPRPADAVEPEKNVVPGLGEVEVNLSLNAEKTEDDYVVTKLSIHVRDTTDIEVFLPVDMHYYCDKDDMNIVLSNRDGVLQYNTYVETVSMDIAGNTVTLNVRFEDGGIVVSTRGINSGVLNYCRDTYQDGITFEIWNYYHDILRTDLQEILNRSTITFTASPGRYVNAYGVVEGDVNPLDCQVLPPSDYIYSSTENFNRIYLPQ